MKWGITQPDTLFSFCSKMRIVKYILQYAKTKKSNIGGPQKKQSGGIKKKKVKCRSIIQDVIMWKTYHGIM